MVTSLNPLRPFDIFEFSQAGEEAQGSLPLSAMPRVLAELAPEAPADARDALFHWRLRGFTRDEASMAGLSARKRKFMSLEVDGVLWLVCQRCLQVTAETLSVRTVLELVHTEAQADAAPLDDDEVDVIVGSSHFNLVELIEDELLLSLPISVKHEVCADVHPDLVSGADGQAVEEGRDLDEDASDELKPSPFAALADLKRRH
jgi:uncharacterized protein